MSVPYKPVPVETARAIAEQYEKSIVIIFTHDPLFGMLHTTTYGVGPQEKEWAAQGGEIATKALGAVVELATDFEDYRIDQARRLLAALKSVVKIADEAFEAWDKDNDMRCGKMLRALSDPKLKGYRPDIDAIHEAIKVAEGFLG